MREPIRRKNSSPFNRTPARNPLQPRRFKVPKPPEKVVRLSPEQQKAFLQQKLEQAAFVGYNGLNVPVKAPETLPLLPVQKQSASGALENNSQPQEVPEIEATRDRRNNWGRWYGGWGWSFMFIWRRMHCRSAGGSGRVGGGRTPEGLQL